MAASLAAQVRCCSGGVSSRSRRTMAAGPPAVSAAGRGPARSLMLRPLWVAVQAPIQEDGSRAGRARLRLLGTGLR
jgi:hypothetical protein